MEQIEVVLEPAVLDAITDFAWEREISRVQAILMLLKQGLSTQSQIKEAGCHSTT